MAASNSRATAAGVAHVGLEGLRRAARRAWIALDRGPRRVGVPRVADRHREAVGSEAPRDGGADAARPAGDDDGLRP